MIIFTVPYGGKPLYYQHFTSFSFILFGAFWGKKKKCFSTAAIKENKTDNNKAGYLINIIMML